jgi:hypothetical protein
MEEVVVSDFFRLISLWMYVLIKILHFSYEIENIVIYLYLVVYDDQYVFAL